MFAGLMVIQGVTVISANWKFVIDSTFTSTKFTAVLKGGCRVVNGPGGGKVLDMTTGHTEMKPADDECFGDLELCTQGLTLSFLFMIKKAEEGAVYLSNGGEHDGSYGLALIYKYQSYHVVVRTKTQEWVVTLNSISTRTWFKMDISFKADVGLKIYQNNVLIGSATQATRRVVSITTQITRTTTFFLGKGSMSTSIKGQLSIGEIRIFNTADRTMLVASNLMDAGSVLELLAIQLIDIMGKLGDLVYPNYINYGLPLNMCRVLIVC